MSERFGIGFNLRRLAAWQIRNFSFNSMCLFNGVPLAASSDGIYSLDTSDSDAGTDIDSIIELVTTDFGALQNKRFRKAYVGYETSGNIIISIRTDEGTFTDFTIPTTEITQKQHRDIISLHRGMKGVYWTFRIQNVLGCDFSIDHIECLPIVLSKGRK